MVGRDRGEQFSRTNGKEWIAGSIDNHASHIPLDQ
jgi:hypothetical protein